MNSAPEFVRSVPDFHTHPERLQVKLFAWYLHKQAGISIFTTADVTRCFDSARLHRPSNTSQRLLDLVLAKEVIKHTNGFALSSAEEQKLEQMFLPKPARPATIAVEALLAALPARLSTPAESDYLVEALLCFKAGASRGAVVMTWNVCYHHLTQHIIDKRLTEFNAEVAAKRQRNAKYAMVAVASLDDFQKWKESEVIDVCKAANIISKEVHKVLVEKLDKRNSAAHPSGSTFDKLMTEAYISDLIQNAMLKIG